ncbi:lantibiotic modifying enzyme [Streptococcus pneumoniae]|nr:lantibiotic modifying enzyme [Streptococcus pneumoniae]
MKYKIKNVHKTLFIKERYQILSERNDNSLNNFSLNNWRSTMSIISEKTFEEMLKLNNYNKKIFSNTVNYDYTEEQIRLYSEYAKNSEWYKFAEGSFEIFRKHPQRINFKKDFSRILEPFIINLLKLINNYLENKEYEWIDKNGNIFSSLVFYLEDLIYPWIVKPLVLEINSLREKGLLEGESEQQRYKYFITLFDKEENILNFYNKYPVLLRQISESCLRFYTYFIEILSNLENDFSVLEEELGLRGKLNDIKFGKGDTHSQGKTVLILFFDDAKIVYKPKNLIINNSLNTIAEYIRKVDEKIRIRIPRTIAYSDHSYEEFIDYLPLEQKKNLPEYYYNFGVLLAFIYLFNGSDIHFENLISYGDMPVIIDFETMLQQPLFDDKTGQSLLDTLFHRVTRTLLLPTEGVKREDGLDVEMSALTGNFKKDAFNGQVLINLNTDKVKFDIGKIDFEGGKNLPVRDGDI